MLERMFSFLSKMVTLLQFVEENRSVGDMEENTYIGDMEITA